MFRAKNWSWSASLLALVLFSAPLAAQLEPMIAPPENPLTPEKALLGKFLFWEEQLSSDDSVACATCHQPFRGGSDPRVDLAQSTNPGPDGMFGTMDDVSGSIGVVSANCGSGTFDDGVFFPERQVTGRKTPSMIGLGNGDNGLFWDGRAGGTFIDPQTGMIAVAAGGALENQAIEPILSSVEMSCDGRTWDDVITKLETVTPMELASDLPPDMVAGLASFPTYPDLFNSAFGTPDITAVRIGFAIASYERTLLPNQTAFDDFLAGNFMALTPNQQAGLDLFNDHCQICHDGNLLSDSNFHNIGVTDENLDPGREEHTGIPNDRGKFRTPPLRNVALRAPFFHNGGKATLDDVLQFYNIGGDFANANLDMDMVPLNLSNPELQQIKDFLENALTDPRVENELFPFDRPKLQVYFRRGDSNRDGDFNIADAVHALDFLFAGTVPILFCADATDANDDGIVDIADPIAMVGRLFNNQPPLPLPADNSFGPDPTPDGLDCRP